MDILNICNVLICDFHDYTCNYAKFCEIDVKLF